MDVAALKRLFDDGWGFHAAYDVLYGSDLTHLHEADAAWRRWEGERTL